MRRKGGLFFLFALGAVVGGVLEFFFLRNRHQIEAGALRSELSVARRQARELERKIDENGVETTAPTVEQPQRITLNSEAIEATVIDSDTTIIEPPNVT